MNEQLIPLESLFATHCADSDIEKTYPAIQMVCNGGKQTTMMEMVEVEGEDREFIRTHGYCLIGGIVNSMQFCMEGLELPNQFEILDIWHKTQGD